ncbi:MAG: hypothetical protein AAF716_11950 [Cyanobacteria bacterium P01_D01_bin.1]
MDNSELLHISLVRAVRRRQGFGILFLQCSPVYGQAVLSRLQADVPQKKMGQITLTKESRTLFRQVADREDVNELDVLFVFGIDEVLAPYSEQVGTLESERDLHEMMKVLPPILNHLNLLRENFLVRFPHICFVYVVSPFSLRFFMYRAIDFFAWHSGIWRFSAFSQAKLMQSGRIAET